MTLHYPSSPRRAGLKIKGLLAEKPGAPMARLASLHQ